MAKAKDWKPITYRTPQQAASDARIVAKKAARKAGTYKKGMPWKPEYALPEHKELFKEPEAEVRVAPIGEIPKVGDYLPKEVIGARPDIQLSAIRRAGAPIETQLKFIRTHSDIALPKSVRKAIGEDFKKAYPGQVYSYETGKFVPATLATVKEREEFYRAYPEAAPPGTPGKILPKEAIAKRKAERKTFEAGHIKLADDKWMAIDDFNELYKYDQEHGTNYQSIGIGKGYDAMLKAMADDRKAAEAALSEYKVPDTEDSYYLDKALRDKVDEKHLLVLFGKDIVREAKREPKEVPFATTTIAPAQSVFMATKSGRDLEKKYPEFTQAIITTLKTADPMDLSEHYGRWVEAWYSARDKLGDDKVPTLEQYMASLSSQLRDYRDYIKSLPKDNPERKLFNEELIRRGITVAAFVATAAVPYTFGAVGVVGTQIVSKVVPATIRAIPVLGKIPQAVVLLSQYLATATPIAYTGATIVEAVQTTDLEHKWQAFEALPASKQDAWAKRSGYDNFQTLTDSEKANVLLHYAVPPEYSLTQWSRTLADHTDRLIELSQKGSTWLGKNAPAQIQSVVTPLRIAGGVVVGSVVEATSYMAQLPLISAALVDKVPSGTTKEFAKEVATGMAAFFTTAIPAAFRADPYFTSGRLIGLFVLSPQAMLKLSKSGFAGLKPSYIPERAMGMEFNTLRVEFTPKQWAITGKMTPAQLKALGTRIEAALLAGKDYVKGFGALKLKVETVPYQKVVGNALFHFTPDITTFKGQVPIKGKLYTSPQAAVRAGMAALVKGQKATHPGLVEVRVPEGFTIKGAPIEKLIGRGKTVEIEAPLKGALDPIPGWQGKGVSSNAYFGSYPIRRFTLQGVDTPIVKLTPAKLAELRARAMTASTADAFVGWHGRMQAWKREVAANKRLTKTLDDISTSISKLKEKEIEVIGKHGEIISQREAIPHPTKAGTIKPRVTAIVRNSKGEIMLVMDRAETSFGLPGGMVDIRWRKGQLGFTRLPDGRYVLKPDGAAHGQIKSETGVGLTKTKLLDTYTGKVNEHALSGSRVYEALGKTDKIDISVGKGELIKAKWWDGKSEITVYPATYDILTAVARKYGLDMSKVKIDASRAVLNRTRDIGFVTRVAKGEKLTPAQIRNINNIEIASLKELRNEIANPNLFDYLKGETDFALLAELIKGRQQAAKWSRIETTKPTEVAKFTKEMVNNLKEILRQAKSMTEAEAKSQYGVSKAELLRRLDTKKLEEAKTPDAISKEVERLANEQAKLENKRLSQEDIRAYVERGDYLNRRYVSYLDRAMRALGTGVQYERIPTELIQHRPTPAEIYKEYRAIEPPRRYEFLRPEIVELRRPPYRPPTERIPPKRIPPERVPPERVPPERPPPEKPPPYKPPPYKPPPVEVPPKKPPPPIIPELATTKAEREDYKGAVAWQQGALLRDGKLVPIWKVWKRPYEQKDLETVFEDELPVGVKTVKGIKSAYATIQQFRGKVAPRETQQADIGAFIATVSEPTPKPGGAGEIKFVRDIRGESDEALRKIALGTTTRQLLKEIYPAKVPKATADRILSDKLSKINTNQIADELTKASITRARHREALKMLPDRERSQVELILSNPEVFAPVARLPRPKYLPKYLRRKKAKTKKVVSEPMLVGARI